jgi:hypothetical protein
MWDCPGCGRSFANRHQVHTCAQLGDLDRHFAGADPNVRAAFDQVLAVVSAFGPVQVLAEKTRIALQVRMSFAAFTPRRHWLTGHLVLARHAGGSWFLKAEELSPRNVVHTFRLTSPASRGSGAVGWRGGLIRSAGPEGGAPRESRTSRGCRRRRCRPG